MIVRRIEGTGAVDLSPLGRCAQRPRQAHRVVGSRVWMAVEGGRAWGYVLTAPLPGLPGLHEIEFFVAPARRRQGIGSLLWQAASAEVAGEPDVLSVSAALDRRGGALARFLAAQGFRPEHVEWEMRLERLDDLAAPFWPAGYEAATFPRPEAITKFSAVYDASFGPEPWYQPFSSGEVAEALEAASDLLFAVNGGEPVGVAWTRVEGELGVVEPIGVVPAHQGRGVGKALLVTALSAMRRRGAEAARLGVWKDNRPAIALYRQLGFRRSGSRTYVAYDFGASPAGRRLR